MKKNIVKSDWLFVGILCQCSGLLIAATAYAYESTALLLFMAVFMSVCGFVCDIQACKELSRPKVKARHRVQRQNNSNAVDFCNRFAKNLESEAKREATIKRATNSGLKVVGIGKEQFTESVSEGLKEFYQVY